jgi:mRNA interferase MazF
MSKALQRELSDAAERTGKAKNAIIIEALVKYLHAMERQSLAEEARRQSELVSSCAAPGDHGKPRPAVVVQSDLFNGTHASIVVCLITSHLEDAPLFRMPVPAGRTTGLKRESQVMADKVIAIPRNKITGRAGTLSAGVLEELDQALRLWLELT